MRNNSVHAKAGRAERWKEKSQRSDLTTPKGQGSHIVKEGKTKFRISYLTQKIFACFLEELFLWDIRKCLKKKGGVIKVKGFMKYFILYSLLVMQNINTSRDSKKPCFKVINYVFNSAFLKPWPFKTNWLLKLQITPMWYPKHSLEKRNDKVVCSTAICFEVSWT